MSTVVSFVNKGIIDPRCITTQGASVKEGENAIGYFGTGLKYAVAIILRGGGKITIWRGTKRVNFSTATTFIRGKEFQLVTMNDQELGFTTDLGKNWKMWMAFRELYCNVLDEDGKMEWGAVAPKEGHTTIVVECAEFANEARRKGDYILEGDPIYSQEAASFFAHASSSVFYRGVRVMDKTYKPWMFTPNIFQQLKLTEDRTVSEEWSIRWAIADAVSKCRDKKFLKRWLSAGKEYMEHGVGFNSYQLKGTVCLEVARSIFHDPNRSQNLNSSIYSYCKGEEGEPVFQIAKLLPVEKSQLAEAVAFCKDIGYDVGEYPITVCETLGENILGSAAVEGQKIFLARTAIAQGKLNLAGTLIEEWAHIKHHFHDCSRNFQNWLLQELVKHAASHQMQQKF